MGLWAAYRNVELMFSVSVGNANSSKRRGRSGRALLLRCFVAAIGGESVDTRQFDYFLTASRLLNFAKAAKAHYMTPQTFTNQIRSLEKELDVKLFEHDNDGWTLTDAGKVLQERLPDVKARIDAMFEEVYNVSQGYDGSLSIVSIDGLVFDTRYMQAMRKLKHDNPRLNIKAQRQSYKGVRKALNNDLCDAVVSMSYDMSYRSDLCSLVLETTQAALAIPLNHPLAAKEEIAVEDLDGIDLYVPGDLSITSEQLLEEVLAKGVNPILHPMRNSSSVVLNVEMGLGVALHFRDTILAGNPHLIMRPIRGIKNYEVALYWKKTNEKPSLKHFVELLSAQYT